MLGDFNDASFDYYGVRSRFFRKDGKFLVETDGPDGKLATFEVKYTFGVDPLQQYLIEFPDGRLQALSIAWDSRPKEQGGQRWFHLYPNEEIRHDDVLHWTKLNQNWNFMCAECHSTGVHKNYDAANDRFATTWAEISVGCEACHGQGSRHVAWARERQSWWPFGKTEDPDKGLLVRFDERRDRRLADRSADRQRRAAAFRRRSAQGGRDLRAVPRPPRPVLRGLGPGPMAVGHASRSRRSRAASTTPTGRCCDEVYNYGSFKQSKMFAAGVTCSDCHEPHSAKLRAAGRRRLPAMPRARQVCGRAHHRHEGATRRSPARPATCRPAPTWWSIAGTITASASRGPICRPSSARPTPATTAMPTSRRNGRRQPSSAGTDPTARASRPMPARSTPRGTDEPDAAALLAAVAADRPRRRSPAPAR